MEASLFLRGLPVHSDWNTFLTDEILEQIAVTEREVIKTGYTPGRMNVLRFLTFPLSSAKIIILGQDPYPQPGAATGRAFEVGNLQSWSLPYKNISLKNIIRAVYKAYTGEIAAYNEIKKKLDNEFPLLPPGKLFAHWESQGILMLNTSFTCEPWKPGSHQKLWKEFTSGLLEFIADKTPDATWFIWGTHASEATRHLKLINSIETRHPMMCYSIPSRSNDFLYGGQNCFQPFIGEIDWTGYKIKEKIKSSGKLF
jgi:uracil-DNA glycosylase